MKTFNLIVGIFILILFGSCLKEKNPIAFKNIVKPYEAISPRLSGILSLNEEFRQFELDKLWAEFDSVSGPLIEEDTLDHEMVFVSLLYRDSLMNQQIEFQVSGIYADRSLGDRVLRQLGKTDLWYRSYKMPKDMCFAYRFITSDSLDNKAYCIDSHNNRKIPHGELKSYSYSILDLSCQEEKYNQNNSEINHGELREFQVESKHISSTKNIHVYLPPDYDSLRSKPYPVIYLFDGFIYRNRVETPNILDNLIAESKTEPMIAVFISSRRKERKIELALYQPFTDFMVNELIPFIEKDYHISTNPTDRILGGISYGGLTATNIAFQHPELFGKVLAQSASYWRSNEVLEDYSVPDYRHDYLIEQFIQSPKKDLKLYLDWGLQENWVLGSNRRMVKVLDQKDYEFKYHEFNGWHDWANSRKSFVDGIVYLMTEE